MSYAEAAAAAASAARALQTAAAAKESADAAIVAAKRAERAAALARAAAQEASLAAVAAAKAAEAALTVDLLKTGTQAGPEIDKNNAISGGVAHKGARDRSCRIGVQEPDEEKNPPDDVNASEVMQVPSAQTVVVLTRCDTQPQIFKVGKVVAAAEDEIVSSSEHLPSRSSDDGDPIEEDQEETAAVSSSTPHITRSKPRSTCMYNSF